MLSVGGLAGPLGRAALFVGLIGAFFGMVAAITGTYNEDRKVLRLLPRFAYVSMFGAVGAFVCMEWAMITRDFSLEYIQKVGSWSTPAMYNFSSVECT